MGNCFSNKKTHGSDDTIRGNLTKERKDCSIDDFYDFVAHLGEGSMGRVSRIKHRKTMKIYALKTIQLSRISDMMIDELRNEIRLLQTLDHPNIIRPIEIFENRRQIFFVMELCSGGDLYQREPYGEKEAADIVRQVLSAIAYMHEKDIAHRDIKFENILFESRADDARIKLIDFGLSKQYTIGKRMKEEVGTLYSMAPEVLIGEYDQACDLWSLGVITFMLLSSQMPFMGPDEFTVVRRIRTQDYHFRGPRWKNCSKAARKFVRDLLRVETSARMTARQALESDWMLKEYSDFHENTKQSVNENMVTSIKHFGDYSKLKKTALMIVAHQSTTDQIKELRTAFENMDEEKNGVITFDELRTILLNFHHSEDEIKDLFAKIDYDASGKISYTEFLAATLETMGFLEREHWTEAFDRLDVDHSGFISKENLKEIIGRSASKSEIDEMMEAADIAKDGQISLDEFIQYMTNTSEVQEVMQNLIEDFNVEDKNIEEIAKKHDISDIKSSSGESFSEKRGDMKHEDKIAEEKKKGKDESKERMNKIAEKKDDDDDDDDDDDEMSDKK